MEGKLGRNPATNLVRFQDGPLMQHEKQGQDASCTKPAGMPPVALQANWFKDSCMICVIDLETTGVDATHDRAVSLGIVKLCPLSWTIGDAVEFRFNPKKQMTQEVIDVHGITNEMAATYPPFEEYAHEIFKLLDGNDIAGFNLFGVDLPILWHEFQRVGYCWEPLKRNIIDAGILFKRREERSLSAASKFYLGKEHVDAHSACNDAMKTAEVLVAQLKRYGLQDIPLPLVESESLYDKPLDVAGKIVAGKDGRPTYAFAKVKGVAVEDDLGFARWMLGKDFHPDTVRIVSDIIDHANGGCRGLCKFKSNTPCHSFRAEGDPEDDYDDYQGEEMPT